MIYTYKIQKAVEFAIKVHETDSKQKRKGKDIPYITHPLTVGLILAAAGANEDVIIAGILHDTLEDSIYGYKITKEMLVEEFNQNVSDLVLSVTEQNKNLSWEERKAEAVEHIKTFSNDSLLLKSADLLSNTTEIVSDYNKIGDEMFNKFNAPKEKILGNYIKTILTIIEKWKESPLADDLSSVISNLNIIISSDNNENGLYLDKEELKTRHIVYTACENEDNCGFIVEFKYPNSTFFYCKEHQMGFNIDLETVNNDGVECKQHSKMERYDVLKEDNLCPKCKKQTMAILSARNN